MIHLILSILSVVFKTRFLIFPEELTEMRKQMKTMEEKNASYMQQTIDLQEVRFAATFYTFLFALSAFPSAYRQFKLPPLQGLF